MQPFSDTLLQGRRALITGGGSGLGLAIAGRFVSLGAEVVICGRRAAVLDGAVADLNAAAGRACATALTCDIRDPVAVAAMFDAACGSGHVDILVNNAAANFIAQTEALSHRAADAVLATSLHGALYCTLEAGRRWIADGRPGVVLSILSTSAITGRAFGTPTAMAKAAVLAMTRSLAVEWGPKGVRLVAIAPGAFPTPGADQQLYPAARAAAADRARQIPLGRVGEHDELANLASYLVSDAAAYVTGEMVVMDGGLHLRSSGAEDLLGWTEEQWAAHRQAMRPRG